MEFALLVPLVGFLVWLSKKYIRLIDERVKKSESHLARRIDTVEHQVTVVVKSESRAVILKDIELIKSQILERLENSMDAHKNLKKCMLEIQELKSITETHQKDLIQALSIFKSHSNQLRDLYKEIRLLKRK